MICESDEAALDATVQADLQTPAFLVCGEHEASPGRLDFCDLRAQFCCQCGVRRAQSSCDRHGLDKCRLTEQRLVVHEHRERTRFTFDVGRHPITIWEWYEQRPTSTVLVLARRRPVTDLQCRIAQRFGQRVAEGARR